MQDFEPATVHVSQLSVAGPVALDRKMIAADKQLLAEAAAVQALHFGAAPPSPASKTMLVIRTKQVRKDYKLYHHKEIYNCHCIISSPS